MLSWLVKCFRICALFLHISISIFLNLLVQLQPHILSCKKLASSNKNKHLFVDQSDIFLLELPALVAYY